MQDNSFITNICFHTKE